MIKAKCNVVVFDKDSNCGFAKVTFPSNCKIHYPEKIPVTYPDHYHSIGSATAFERTETSITADVTIDIFDSKKTEDTM